MNRRSDSLPLILLWVTFFIFILGRWLGTDLFTDHWSLSHWQAIPGWYPPVWIATTIILATLFIRYGEKLGELFDRRLNLLIGLTTIFLLMLIWRFDSFLYGGGNLRVAQIAQVETIILRWYEFGSIAVTSGLLHLLQSFGLANTTAGVIAWQSLAFFSTGMSLWGAARIAAILTTDSTLRMHLFLSGFFGPQALLYFGFIGFEPIVIPITLWFGYVTLLLFKEYRRTRIWLLWGLTLLAVVMHATLAFLIPAAMFVTLAAPVKSDRRTALALAVSLITIGGMLIFLYARTESSMQLSQQLLFFEGKRPFNDYSLISVRRLVDVLGLFSMLAPLVLVYKLLAARELKVWLNERTNIAFMITVISGTLVLLVSDPINSIALDLPRMSAYLAPFSLIVMLLLSRYPSGRNRNIFLSCMTAFTIAIPLSYLPAYRSLATAEQYVAPYFDQHPIFWRTGAISLRDSWFYLRDFDRASDWEAALPIKSTDFLNIRGCRQLVNGGEIDAALPILYRMVANQPYWIEPRLVLAAANMNVGRFERARPQIDTSLMLSPYSKYALAMLSDYYRQTGMPDSAINAIQKAREIYPSDLNLAATEMTYKYLIDDFRTADSLAIWIIQENPAMPEPYLVQGWIFDKRGNSREAARFYKIFIERASQNDPDLPVTQERLKEIESLPTGLP